MVRTTIKGDLDMTNKIITLGAVGAASAALTAGVGLAQGSGVRTAPAHPTPQKMSHDSMGDMRGGRDTMGRAMHGRVSDADVTAMANGMGMKLDPASVQRMVRMHNGMMRGADAMMQHR